MVRSLRIGALIAVLACTAPSWGQVLQQERFIMVKEDGKPAVKCKVIKTWKDKDGSTVILLGYYNRNRTQAVDIPIGPNDRIEPGGPDQDDLGARLDLGLGAEVDRQVVHRDRPDQRPAQAAATTAPVGA